MNDDGTAVIDDGSAHNVYDFEYSVAVMMTGGISGMLMMTTNIRWRMTLRSSKTVSVTRSSARNCSRMRFMSAPAVLPSC